MTDSDDGRTYDAMDNNMKIVVRVALMKGKMQTLRRRKVYVHL